MNEGGTERRRETKREREIGRERGRRKERVRDRKRERERKRERDIIGCSLLKMTFVTMDISMEINSVRMEKMITDDMTNLNE